jgi:hypothetical protein
MQVVLTNYIMLLRAKNLTLNPNKVVSCEQSASVVIEFRHEII